MYEHSQTKAFLMSKLTVTKRLMHLAFMREKLVDLAPACMQIVGLKQDGQSILFGNPSRPRMDFPNTS